MIPFAPGFFGFRQSLFLEDFEDAFNYTLYSAGAGGTASRTDIYSPGTDYELNINPSSNGYPVTVRFDDSPEVADFDLSWVQSQCSDNVDSVNTVWNGVVMRTTYWGVPSGLGSYNHGLYVYLHRDGTLYLSKGTDSATPGGLSVIASVASGIGNYPGNISNPNVRTMVNMRWQAIGSAHKVWVNDVLKIDVSDASYATNAGKFAAFTSPHAWTGIGSQFGYPALWDDIRLS